MGEATKIVRSSIQTFINGYDLFLYVAILFVLPFSTSTLFSDSIISSSPYSLQFISGHFRGLFQSASFPVSSPFFSFLNLTLSETLFSSIFTLPFSLSFLILAKASVIGITHNFPFCKKSLPTFSSILHLYSPLFKTHILNSFVMISVNATIFALFFLVFNAAELFGVSSGNYNFLLTTMYLIGAVFYAVVILSTMTICNLAMVMSGMEICDGYVSVLLKVCVLIKGRITTALVIAFPCKLVMFAVESLFHYRVMRQYYLVGKLNWSIAHESFTIAYIHSVVVIIEIIASCVFYRRCKIEYNIEHEPGEEKAEV